MKYTILIYLFYWTTIVVNAAPPVFSPDVITLDFSNGHSIEAFKKSGIAFKDVSNSSSQMFYYRKQPITIKLPGGRVFEQKVRLGDAKGRDGDLLQITTTGVVMPHDEAYQVAKKIHLNLGLPTEKLDQWYESEKDQGRNAEGYSISANMLMYPRVSMSIRSSMNKLYPWVVGLKISWNWKKHRDWDEERANRENPRPLPQYATVSLEPPSGKVYDRSEAYKDLEASVPEKPTSPPVEQLEKITPEPTFAKKSVPNKKPAKIEDIEPASDNPFPYWIFIIGGVVAVGLVVVLKRKK